MPGEHAHSIYIIISFTVSPFPKRITDKTTEMDAFNERGFPVFNLSNDGWSNEHEATATCFCGAVQLVLVSLSIHFVAKFNNVDGFAHSLHFRP
jgi:hypothetical protein